MCSSSFSLTSNFFSDLKQGCASPVPALFEFSEEMEKYLDDLELAVTKTVCFLGKFRRKLSEI